MQSREEPSLGGMQIIIQICQGGEKRKKENITRAQFTTGYKPVSFKIRPFPEFVKMQI